MQTQQDSTLSGVGVGVGAGTAADRARRRWPWPLPRPRPRDDGWTLRLLGMPIAMGGAAGLALLATWLGAPVQTATLVFGPAFLLLWLALYRMA